MKNIASHLSNFLNDYCVHTRIATIPRSNYPSGQSYNYLYFEARAADATGWIKDMQNSLYLALHSDAIGSTAQTDVYGVKVRFNQDWMKSFSEEMTNAIKAILPLGSNRSSPVKDTNKLGEMRATTDVGLRTMHIEAGFHDCPPQIEFLITNEKKLAETIGKVLVDQYGLSKNA